MLKCTKFPETKLCLLELLICDNSHLTSVGEGEDYMSVIHIILSEMTFVLVCENNNTVKLNLVLCFKPTGKLKGALLRFW